MGVGKTSVGAELARQLDRPFYDSDDEIRDRQGKTSGELAGEQGLLALHELELRTFLDLTRRSTPGVIASAASVVDFDDGRELLARCITIRLTAGHDELVRRMQRGDHRRDVGEEEFAELNRKRSPHLAETAVASVDTTEMSVAEVARTIISRHRDAL